MCFVFTNSSVQSQCRIGAMPGQMTITHHTWDPALSSDDAALNITRSLPSIVSDSNHDKMGSQTKEYRPNPFAHRGQPRRNCLLHPAASHWDGGGCRRSVAVFRTKLPMVSHGKGGMPIVSLSISVIVLDVR